MKRYHSVRSEEEKVVLIWKNLTFETMVKDAQRSTPFRTEYNTRKILKGLSGRAESKQLIAIMGPTGCGKTSLMSLLAARFPSGGSSRSSLHGSIYFNGTPRNEEHFRKISAYVMQDDNMFAHLTVYETLTLSAHFFLPSALTDADKNEIVMGIISELGLIKATDTIIGDEKVRGVSGGERKRVSIAVQLLTDPAVLFLDEPTSGLDAFQAQAVMDVLKNLAIKGRLVISVIHQPRSSIYSMFDQLLLLSEGHTIYFGPASTAVDYFASIGFACPEHFNPADYFLDILSPDNRSPELEKDSSQRIRRLAQHFEQTKSAVDLQTPSTQEGAFVSIQAIGGNSVDYQRLLRAFLLLCWRAWTEQFRNWQVLVIKYFFSGFFALVVGGIFSGTENDQTGIQNRRGVLYFVMINQAFNAVSAVLATFPNEKMVIHRETTSNSYAIWSYCLAKIFVEMPLNLIPVLIYSIIIHPLVGLNPDTFGFYILISLFINFVIILLGLAISAFAPNADAAAAMGPPFLIIGILFGGFYISIDSLPIVLNWIPYISVFQWGFRGLCVNEFKGMTFECDSLDPNECMTTGEEVLEGLDFADHTLSYAMFGLGMLGLCYLAGLYIILVLNQPKFLRLGHIGRHFVPSGEANGGEGEEGEGESADKAKGGGGGGEGARLEGQPRTYQLVYGEATAQEPAKEVGEGAATAPPP